MHSVLCFSPLWKTVFYQARQLFDRFSSIEPLFLLFSTKFSAISIHRNFLEFISIGTRSIKKLSIWLIDPWQILTPSRLASARQLLDLSRPSCMHCFFTCLASFYYLVIRSILFHYIHAYIWILCAPLIIFYHHYVSRVKFYSFLYPLSIMTKRGRKCDFFLRFYMLGGEIYAFIRGSCVSSCQGECLPSCCFRSFFLGSCTPVLWPFLHTLCLSLIYIYIYIYMMYVFFTYLYMCCFFSFFIHIFLHVCNLYFCFTHDALLSFV